MADTATCDADSGTDLGHGYTLADADRAARIAAARTRGWTLDGRDRYDIAQYAIVEHLLTTAERPASLAHLVTVGRDAVANQRKREYHHHGLSQNERTPMPRHAAYWETFGRPTPGPERQVVDRMALRQIMPRLSPAERAAVEALAEHGTHQAAAAALGIKYTTFAQRLSHARARFRALWHEGETPSTQWRVDVHNTRAMKDPQVAAQELATFSRLRGDGMKLKQIAAQMGVSLTTASRLSARYRAQEAI